MEIRIPYGRTLISLTIPDRFKVDIIEPPKIPAAEKPLQLVDGALENLLGDVDWAEFSGAKSVAIAVNDKTRPVPHEHLLPSLMARLERLGIPDAAITFYVAVGTHPPMTADEFPEIFPGSILQRYRVVSHDSENDEQLVYLGETQLGTPVWTGKGCCQSDLKIVLGNIEPHQFVGFSGGVKTAAIGLAGIKTINVNHALMTHPDSQLGEFESNPARQDVEEIGKKIGVHLVLNTILNQEKQIVHVLAGEPDAVMQAGIPLAREACQVAVSEKYNLMISSPGGHPKDINIYQSQKGLGHAVLVTQPGGTIILVASCSEGSGSPHYEDWMIGKHSHKDVLERFDSEGFRIGPHKAFQIARDASQFRLMIYSDLDENMAKRLLLNSVSDVQSAVNAALKELQPGDCIGVLPHASSTIPYHNTLRGDQ